MSFKQELAAQVAQRRTFAIISHPDAGKTTMTEKLLLWGQAIQVAGMVKSRKKQGESLLFFILEVFFHYRGLKLCWKL